MLSAYANLEPNIIFEPNMIQLDPCNLLATSLRLLPIISCRHLTLKLFVDPSPILILRWPSPQRASESPTLTESSISSSPCPTSKKSSTPSASTVRMVWSRSPQFPRDHLTPLPSSDPCWIGLKTIQGLTPSTSSRSSAIASTTSSQTS